MFTVRIYNYAAVDGRLLKRAVREAVRLFRLVGAEMSWRECPVGPERDGGLAACPDRIEPNELVLKLLPKSMSRKYEFRREVFGFALPATAGPSVESALFFERVNDLAFHGGAGGGSFSQTQALILGHIAAHEIGHLLLGPGRHSQAGLMSLPWTRRELTAMARGRLRFTVEEGRRIRREAATRATDAWVVTGDHPPKHDAPAAALSPSPNDERREPSVARTSHRLEQRLR